MMRSRTDQRGAVAVFAALAMTAMLAAAAFAVDLGMQRVARSDAQSIADVVALDLSHELNQGKTTSQLSASDGAWVTQSLGRNKDVLGTGQGHLPRLVVTWGEMKNGSFRSYNPSDPDEDDLVPSAVRVVAHTETGFVFAASRTGKANRAAVASADKGACFRIGSFVARVQSGESALLNPLLNGLLGSSLNLDLAGYQGIAAANVSLLDLVNTGNLGVGTVSELLGADEVNVADLVQASIDVLSAPGKGTSTVTLTALEAIRTALLLSAPKIKIADLIAASPSDPSALESSVNVLDLITGAVLLANKEHSVAIPALTVGPVAGITATTSLKVIEGPNKACTNTGNLAETSQVELTTKITSNAIILPVSLAGLANVTARVEPIDLTIVTKIASADARLLSVDGCETGGPQNAKLQVNSSAVPAPSVSGTIRASLTAKLATGAASDLLTNLLSGLGGLLSPLASLGLLDVGKTQLAGADLTVNLTAGVQMASATGVTASTQTIDVPLSYWEDPNNPRAYTVPGTLIPAISQFSLQPTTVTVGGSVTKQKVLLGVLGFPILGSSVFETINGVGAAATAQLGTALTDQVRILLNGLTANLQSTVINQVSRMLGLNVGGADLWVENAPKCGAPRLVQ